MGEWKEIQLGKLGKTYTGLSGKTKDDFGFGKPYIPYLNVFQNNKIKPSQLDFVNIKPDEKQNQVKYGDLFFTTSSETIEEVGMTSVLLHDLGEVYLNSFCFGFRLNDFDNLLPEYVPYLFRSDEIRHKISLQGQGSTRYNLSKTELLKKLFLNLPSKPEQTRIAEILSTADEVIAHTEALIAKYQRTKTGLMQDLLTRGIDENGNIRSKETHKFVVKNSIEVPKEWEVKQIQEVAILKSGGTPSRQNLSFWNGDTPWVKTGEINYEIICKTEEYITEKGLTKSSAVLFPKDTILMALYGQGKTRGRVAILGIVASTNQACIGFLNLNGITRDFLYVTLTNEYENLRELSNDGAQKNLSGALLNKYKIKVPCNIDEQIRIDSVFLEIDNLIKEQKNKLSKLQSLKTGLMQDLLSGNVRVNI